MGLLVFVLRSGGFDGEMGFFVGGVGVGGIWELDRYYNAGMSGLGAGIC